MISQGPKPKANCFEHIANHTVRDFLRFKKRFTADLPQISCPGNAHTLDSLVFVGKVDSKIQDYSHFLPLHVLLGEKHNM